MTYINTSTSGFGKSLTRYYHFTLNLVGSDLRTRFRRTMLGASWAIIQPLFFTLFLSIVFSRQTNTDWVKYSVYVFSGIVIWELFGSSINLGSGSINAGAQYLRQYRLPVYVFPIRVVLLSLVTSFFSSVGLAIWILIFEPGAVSWTWLLFPVFLVIMAVFIAPFAAVASYLGLMFRDFENVVSILMTALWFWSPVFMSRAVFDDPSLQFISLINPARALLDIGRGLLLQSKLPDAGDLLILIVWWLIVTGLATLAIRRLRRSLYYHL